MPFGLEDLWLKAGSPVEKGHTVSGERSFLSGKGKKKGDEGKGEKLFLHGSKLVMNALDGNRRSTYCKPGKYAVVLS